LDGDQLLGWLGADNLIRQEPWSDYQLELLGLYATSLGYLLIRKRFDDALRVKEEATRAFQEKLKALHEVSFELSNTHSLDDLFRRAIELGCSKLGFDRLGLWLLDADPKFIVGTFGIDEYGQIRDERNQRLPISPGEYVEEWLDGRVFAATRNDVPLYNDRHEIIGIGWKAVSQMWDGERSIGWLSTDTLFSKRPLSDYQLELLSLYATTLGHLATVRKTEETLIAERNLFRTVIDTVPDYIYVRDRNGRFLLGNEASWKGTPGLTSEEELIGKTDFDIHPLEMAKQFWAADQQVMASGRALINVEEPGRPQDGEPRTLLTTKVPLRSVQGDLIGLVGVSRDITELKRIEREALELAVERERINVLRESITSISHDLRTPLSIINSSLYLLEHLTDPKNQKDKLETIKQQTALLERFIEEVLFSSLLHNAFEISQTPINVNNLVTNAVQSLSPAAEKKNLTVAANLQPTLPAVLGEKTKLERVLANLLQNAITYTREGGSIELRTFVRDAQVGVEVSDTGIGISEDNLPYIFDHFYRADKARTMGKSGMGLGLAIVKQIVEMHGGIIQVESILGQGSTFRVLLPILVDDQSERTTGSV
jgi:PAS domain S-box-containing protein